MKFPSKEKIEMLRKMYPAGTKLELLSMDDVQAPPVGTIGTVDGIDDAGQIVVTWKNGSSLSLIPGVDGFRKVGGEKMTKEVRDAILKVRDSGRTNMMDARMVQYIANEMGLYELVIYILS